MNFFYFSSKFHTCTNAVDGQRGQMNGFSPVWRRMCSLSAVEWANRRPHSVHGYGFSPKIKFIQSATILNFLATNNYQCGCVDGPQVATAAQSTCHSRRTCAVSPADVSWDAASNGPCTVFRKYCTRRVFLPRGSRTSASADHLAWWTLCRTLHNWTLWDQGASSDAPSGCPTNWTRHRTAYICMASHP